MTDLNTWWAVLWACRYVLFVGFAIVGVLALADWIDQGRVDDEA